MDMLYFVLDLRSLSISLLNDVKQCLLQLANLYGIFVPRDNRLNFVLEDRIGLCYIPHGSSSEAQVAYSPSRHSFRLIDFHRAVHGLASDSYSPQMHEDACTLDVDFSLLLNDRMLCALGENEIKMKVIFISSSLPSFMSESTTRKTLLDAADKDVSFEFVFLEDMSNPYSSVTEHLMDFKGNIGYLRNCSADVYLPDAAVLHGLVKHWLQHLKRDLEPHLQACLIFERNTMGTIDKIHCSATVSVDHITYNFSTSHSKVDDRKSTTSNSGPTNLESGHLSVDLHIVERTNLASLCEGAIMGIPYIVFPSASNDRDADSENSIDFELNIRLFKALSEALHHLDQGLICWSNFDINSMRRTALRCYYVLQSSDKGIMLLRRIAGAEEISLLPDTNFSSSSITEEMRNSVEESLLKLEVKDYNPVMHVSGLQQYLNMLVEESLQVRCGDQDETRLVYEQSDPLLEELADDEQQMECLLAREWEQLVVDDDTCKLSPLPLHSTMERRRSDTATAGGDPAFGVKQQQQQRIGALSSDKATSRILERLEAPRQQLKNTSSPSLLTARASDKSPNPLHGNRNAINGGCGGGSCLITSSRSQPVKLKPSFSSRTKRKQI